MKIAILTLPLHVNYGGNVQNFALQHTLHKLGHDVVTINCQEDNVSSLRYCLSTLKRLIQQPKNSRHFIFTKNEKRYISQNHKKFIDDYINLTIPVEFSSLNSFFEKNKFDAVFVGSDQVWRPKYTPCIESYFLDFIKDNTVIKKISYAASFGSDKWEYNSQQQSNCKSLIQKFNALSVRESIGTDMCEEYFGVKAQHVLDPTMLLTKEEYIDIFKNENLPNNKGGLFNYTLDVGDEKSFLIKDIALSLNMKCFTTYPERTKKNTVFIRDLNGYRYPSVQAWLKSFFDADFIITDSFHGTVFSIIFNKPFIALSNQERGAARFISLLKMFNLESRLVTNVQKFDKKIIEDDIDYEVVNERLEKLRSSSLSFIKDALKY
ncbi:TPA: polysaccharide pyruvyl transferase family protein [Raoultella planticola]